MCWKIKSNSEIEFFNTKNEHFEKSNKKYLICLHRELESQTSEKEEKVSLVKQGTHGFNLERFAEGEVKKTVNIQFR